MIKTYEELSDLRDRFLKIGKYSADAAPGTETEASVTEAPAETTAPVVETAPAETPAPVKETQAASDDELDDLLADLG